MGSSPAYPSDLTDDQWALIEPLVPVRSTPRQGHPWRAPAEVPPPPHRGCDLVPGSDGLLVAAAAPRLPPPRHPLLLLPPRGPRFFLLPGGGRRWHRRPDPRRAAQRGPGRRRTRSDGLGRCGGLPDG